MEISNTVINHATLSLYHIFAATVKAGSISGGAKALYISQPAVSKSIKKLEDILGVQLLVRNSRGIGLTAEGQLLYEYIRTAFDTIKTGEESLRRINELGIGHIRIGVSSTLCKHMLLPQLKDFLALHPHIQIAIDCQSTAQTISLLESKEIDIGLIAKPDNSKNLTLIPFGEIEDIFVATPQYIHSLKEREHIEDHELLSHASLILLDKNNMTRQYVDSYLRQWNIDTDRAMEVGSMELLIDFVKTGLGAGCIIGEFIKEDIKKGQLLPMKLPSPIPSRTVCFAYGATHPLNNAAQQFIDFIETSTVSQQPHYQ